MKFQFSFLTSFVVPALAQYATIPDWHPPSSGDVRGPCPMLNTLANHGYLPHTGKDISLDIVIDALDTALNIGSDVSTLLYENAITTNPEPNATTFSLENLSRHNILEHDASLSRSDFFWSNDSHTFNQTVFDETRSYWTSPVINVEQAAAAREARLETSQATNPTFSMSELGGEFSVGETAAYIIVLGDAVSGLVQRSFVEYLFENERLPVSVGWSRAQDLIDQSVLFGMMDRISNATVPSSSNSSPEVRRSRIGMHNIPRVSRKAGGEF